MKTLSTVSTSSGQHHDGSTGLIVGVDVGTTAVKVAVAVAGGPAVPAARVEVPWTDTPTGAEIDPALLVEVVLRALGQACDAHPALPVAAVGIASFAESVVLADDAGDPLQPLVAWHDSRGGPEAEQLGSAFGPAAFSSRTGLPVSALCSAAKVRAAALAGLDLSRVAGVFSATDWLAHVLTGRRGFDLSLASRTGWLDLVTRDWAPALVAWTGLPPEAMPVVTESGSSRGWVRRGRAGVPPSCHGALVVCAGMDHLVAAVGAGASSPGDVWDSCGTAEAFVRSTEPLPAARVLAAVRGGMEVGWHADGSHHYVLGAQRSGYAFERVLRALGIHSAAELHRFEGARERPGPATDGRPGDVYGSGFDAARHVAGSDQDPAQLWSSLVEQVAVDGAALVQATDDVAGPHRRVVVGGGWADSAWFRESKSRLLGGVETCAVEQPGAAGAIELARRALARTVSTSPG